MNNPGNEYSTDKTERVLQNSVNKQETNKKKKYIYFL